jgi:hypothetical protein
MIVIESRLKKERNPKALTQIARDQDGEKMDTFSVFQYF